MILNFPSRLDLKADQVPPALLDPTGSIVLSGRDLNRIARSLPGLSPPGSESQRDGLLAVRAIQAMRTPEAVAESGRWYSRPIALPWLEIARATLDAGPDSDPTATLRGLAFTAIAIHDALRSARVLDARYARPSPSQLDPEIVPLKLPDGPRGGSPSPIAAASTAAAEVLAYLCPDQADDLRAEASEASDSQLIAGRNLPEDLDLGARLGRAVAAVAIRRAALDGFRIPIVLMSHRNPTEPAPIRPIRFDHDPTAPSPRSREPAASRDFRTGVRQVDDLRWRRDPGTVGLRVARESASHYASMFEAALAPKFP